MFHPLDLQQEEGPSRGLPRDYETSDGTFWGTTALGPLASQCRLTALLRSASSKIVQLAKRNLNEGNWILLNFLPKTGQFCDIKLVLHKYNDGGKVELLFVLHYKNEFGVGHFPVLIHIQFLDGSLGLAHLVALELCRDHLQHLVWKRCKYLSRTPTFHLSSNLSW